MVQQAPYTQEKLSLNLDDFKVQSFMTTLNEEEMDLLNGGDSSFSSAWYHTCVTGLSESRNRCLIMCTE